MHKNKRCPFSENENKIILESVKEIGEDWEQIAHKLTNRTPKQCHDRYYNYLREGLKKEPWTTQEDEILLRLLNEIGPKWSKMTSQLPGRSGNDIKNRWHKHLIRDQPTFMNTQNKKLIDYEYPSYDIQYYPYNFNPQFNNPMFINIAFPITQMNYQMIPYEQPNNITFLEYQKVMPKKQKVAHLMNNQKSEPKDKNNFNKELHKTGEEKIQLKNANSNAMKEPTPDKFTHKSSNQKDDNFSSSNFNDIDIQEFFDNLNLTNVDYFSLM